MRYFVLLLLAARVASGADMPISQLPFTNRSPDTAELVVNQPYGNRATNDTMRVSVGGLFAKRGPNNSAVMLGSPLGTAPYIPYWQTETNLAKSSLQAMSSDTTATPKFLISDKLDVLNNTAGLTNTLGNLDVRDFVQSRGPLVANGAFVIAQSASIVLNSGVNNVSTANRSRIALASMQGSGVQVRLQTGLDGQLLTLVNGSPGSFRWTLFDDAQCYDDNTKLVSLDSNFTPVSAGDEIRLVYAASGWFEEDRHFVGGGALVVDKVKVDTADTQAGYLADKIAAGSNVTITTNNVGGAEQLVISSTGTGGGGTGSYNFVAPLTVNGTDVSIQNNGITATQLRQSAGQSVMGKPTAGVGPVQDIAAAADNTFLGRSGGVLSFFAYPDNFSNQKVQVKNNGSLVGTRRGINFIPGSNIGLSVVDQAGTDVVDVTITAADAITIENLTWSATVNFNPRVGGHYKQVSLLGNTDFTVGPVKGMGDWVTVFITSTTSSRATTWPAGWHWMATTPPASIAANKVASITIFYRDGSDANAIVNYAVEL